MAAHLYLPKNRRPDDKLPAVVICAGTGGTKEQTQDLVRRGVPSSFHVIAGITHYGVYGEGFAEATRVELEWFDKHLKK